MSEKTDLKRIARLIALFTLLQGKRSSTSKELANKFRVSQRTIFRDLHALTQAGVPIVNEPGKGFSLMEGYTIPPIMFTENEANALITAEQLVLKNRDRSLVNEYREAVIKVRAVIGQATNEKVELLSNRIAINPAVKSSTTSGSLMMIQKALTDLQVLKIKYRSANNEVTDRQIEPFAFYYSTEQMWLLIAYCRMRKDFRMFRLDKIDTIEVLPLTFKPHKITLREYLDEKEKKFRHS